MASSATHETTLSADDTVASVCQQLHANKLRVHSIPVERVWPSHKTRVLLRNSSFLPTNAYAPDASSTGRFTRVPPRPKEWETLATSVNVFDGRTLSDIVHGAMDIVERNGDNITDKEYKLNHRKVLQPYIFESATSQLVPDIVVPVMCQSRNPYSSHSSWVDWPSQRQVLAPESGGQPRYSDEVASMLGSLQTISKVMPMPIIWDEAPEGEQSWHCLLPTRDVLTHGALPFLPYSGTDLDAPSFAESHLPQLLELGKGATMPSIAKPPGFFCARDLSIFVQPLVLSRRPDRGTSDNTAWVPAEYLRARKQGEDNDQDSFYKLALETIENIEGSILSSRHRLDNWDIPPDMEQYINTIVA